MDIASTTHDLYGNYIKQDSMRTMVSDQIAAAEHLRQPILPSPPLSAIAIKSKKQSLSSNADSTITLNKNARYQNYNKPRPNNLSLDVEFEQKFTLNDLSRVHNRKKNFKRNKRAKSKSSGDAKDDNSSNNSRSKLGLDKILQKKGDFFFSSKVRKAVSKKKRRFIDKKNNFDLDLTYITKRIIAMGYPAEGNEAMYRNPMHEVQRFLQVYHKNHFKIYNLCIEKDRQYPASKFTSIGGEVATYPFKDHNAPELELILEFSKDVHEWLTRHKDNIVCVHCKAGKGRTGVMICSYLAFAKICKDSADALQKYGEARTKNAKGM